MPSRVTSHHNTWSTQLHWVLGVDESLHAELHPARPQPYCKAPKGLRLDLSIWLTCLVLNCVPVIHALVTAQWYLAKEPLGYLNSKRGPIAKGEYPVLAAAFNWKEDAYSCTPEGSSDLKGKGNKRGSLFKDLEDVSEQRGGVEANLNWGKYQVRLRDTCYLMACLYTNTLRLSHWVISQLS